MPKSSSVKSRAPGKSGVTPCKHDLLNKMLGRELGVLSRGILPVERALFYDLTAGDGAPYVVKSEEPLFPDEVRPFEQSCSPGIFLRHLTWGSERVSIPIHLSATEKQAATHSKLVSNAGHWLNAHGWGSTDLGRHARGVATVDLLHANAREIEPPGNGAHASAFVYNDPNHIEDWSLTPEFLRGCPQFTVSLSTLGCNVGGLKRIQEESRREWFMRVELLCDCLLKNWHDACLFSIGGADQWAYLITAPLKWRDRITEDCLAAATKLEKKISAEPQVVWRKEDPGGFYEIERFLFLTRDEYLREVQL
jgi:hypothetical protein